MIRFSGNASIHHLVMSKCIKHALKVWPRLLLRGFLCSAVRSEQNYNLITPETIWGWHLQCAHWGTAVSDADAGLVYSPDLKEQLYWIRFSGIQRSLEKELLCFGRVISMCGVAKVTMCLCDVAVYSQEVQLAQEVLLHPEEENNNYKQSKGNIWIYARTCGKDEAFKFGAFWTENVLIGFSWV